MGNSGSTQLTTSSQRGSSPVSFGESSSSSSRPSGSSNLSASTTALMVSPSLTTSTLDLLVSSESSPTISSSIIPPSPPVGLPNKIYSYPLRPSTTPATHEVNASLPRNITATPSPNLPTVLLPSTPRYPSLSSPSTPSYPPTPCILPDTPTARPYTPSRFPSHCANDVTSVEIIQKLEEKMHGKVWEKKIDEDEKGKRAGTGGAHRELGNEEGEGEGLARQGERLSLMRYPVYTACIAATLMVVILSLPYKYSGKKYWNTTYILYLMFLVLLVITNLRLIEGALMRVRASRYLYVQGLIMLGSFLCFFFVLNWADHIPVPVLSLGIPCMLIYVPVSIFAYSAKYRQDPEFRTQLKRIKPIQVVVVMYFFVMVFIAWVFSVMGEGFQVIVAAFFPFVDYIYKYIVLKLAKGRISNVFRFFYVFLISNWGAAYWLNLLVPRAESIAILVALIASQFLCLAFYVVRSSSYYYKQIVKVDHLRYDRETYRLRHNMSIYVEFYFHLLAQIVASAISVVSLPLTRYSSWNRHYYHSDYQSDYSFNTRTIPFILVYACMLIGILVLSKTIMHNKFIVPPQLAYQLHTKSDLFPMRVTKKYYTTFACTAVIGAIIPYAFMLKRNDLYVI